MADTQNTNDLQNPISKLDNLETKTNKTDLDNLFAQEKALIDSIKDEKLKKAAQEEYEEMLNRYKQEKESIHQEISETILNDIKNEFKSDITALDKVSKLEFLSSLDGYDTFKNLLDTSEQGGGLPEDIKEQIYNIFENTSDTDLETYFTMEAGSNIVDLAGSIAFINYFKESIGVYTKEIDEILKLDINNLSSEEKKYYSEKIKSFYGNISDDIKKKLQDKEDEIGKKDKENVDIKVNTTEKLGQEFNEGLRKINLDKISDDSIKTQINELLLEQNSTKHQQKAVKLMEYLTNPKNKVQLQQFIQAIPQEERKAFIENFSNFVGGLTISTEKGEKIDTQKLADDFKIEANKYIIPESDKVIDGTTTKIVGENGYALEVEYSSKELQKIMANPINVMSNKERAEFTDKKIELKTEINELDEKIKSLDDIIAKVKLLKELKQNPEKNKEEIAKLEEILSKVDILKKVNSLEELEAERNRVKDEKEKAENELKNVEEKFQEELESRFKEKSKKGYEEEEISRQIVLLLDSIGFTLIPKHITDDIIATINKNPEHYGFDSRIDLKNGNFGGPNTILTKERFIKKFNKMISGKEGEPITTNDINNILVKKLEKDKDSQAERNKELLAKFSTYNIMSDLGTWDREKLESNLTIKEKETPKTEK